MNRQSLEEHLTSQRRRGSFGHTASVGSAGGAACGDVIAIAIEVGDGRISSARFEASGCGAARAAASAAAELVEGRGVLEVAATGADDISSELGGLTRLKRHAAELAADAMHRALGKAVRETEAPALDTRRGRVLVALSGGVDSAVAAIMLRERGEEVVAVTLELWADSRTDGDKACCSPQAVIKARDLAHSLGLPHLTLDLRDAFRAQVVDRYLAEQAAGRTPNPCVTCNGTVRLKAMIKLADRLGATSLATGHYARLDDDGLGPLLVAGVDTNKDQSYMLAAVDPAMLRRMRFPLGGMTKQKTRRIAEEAGLGVARNPESQDLCFLAGTSAAEFMARHGDLNGESGDIVDSEGRVLGRHRGYRHYTVGQRKGLGVSGPRPLYVLATDAHRNRVVVGPRSMLKTQRVRLAPARLHRDGGRVSRVKMRYRSESVPCVVEGAPKAGGYDSLVVAMQRPVSGAAPGQLACLLEGERVVGWGTIAGSLDRQDADSQRAGEHEPAK